MAKMQEASEHTQQLSFTKSLSAAILLSLALVPANTALAEATYGPVKSGDMLSRIAKKIQGNDRSTSVAKISNAIFKLNPDAFMYGDIDLLKIGVMLKVPSMGSNKTTMASTSTPSTDVTVAINTAKSAAKQAKALGFEWTTMGKQIKKAEAAAKEGNNKKAIKLARAVTQQLTPIKKQAELAKTAAPRFAKAPDMSAAKSEAATSAINVAKDAQKQAKALGFEWTTMGKQIKKAEAAAKDGNDDKAIKLANVVASQLVAIKKQAELAKTAGPKFPKAPEVAAVKVEGATEAITAAKDVQKQAKALGFEWTTMGKQIKKAEAAAKEGNETKAAEIANVVIRQLVAIKKQAELAKTAGPRF